MKERTVTMELLLDSIKELKTDVKVSDKAIREDLKDSKKEIRDDLKEICKTQKSDNKAIKELIKTERTDSQDGRKSIWTDIKKEKEKVTILQVKVRMLVKVIATFGLLCGGYLFKQFFYK